VKKLAAKFKFRDEADRLPEKGSGLRWWQKHLTYADPTDWWSKRGDKRWGCVTKISHLKKKRIRNDETAQRKRAILKAVRRKHVQKNW